MEANAACPTRAEALHGAARFCRNKGIYERGYEFAAKGLVTAYPNKALFVEDWIYEYGLLDELAVNAYWTERYKECADACDRLLSEGKLPTDKRDRVLKNRQFAIDKLAAMQEAASHPTAGAAPTQDADQWKVNNGKTLCLNMIVKNEMANLERCLAAVADHIDCWVIGDTGSTDGTQDFIKSFFAARDIPGELHSFPFENFEQARNAALDCAYASPLSL